MARPLLLVLALCSCTREPRSSAPSCELVGDGHGPPGTAPVSVEQVVSGLEVPWGLAFLSADEWLVTERPGRLRRVLAGALEPEPVATIPIGASAEGGLLDIALHPEFGDNRLFYLYVTAPSGDSVEN